MTTIKDLLNDALIEYADKKNELPSDDNYPEAVDELRKKIVDETTKNIKERIVG